MAGLMGRFVYVDDLGAEYFIRQDASNATIAGNAAYTGTPELNDLPRSVRPRYRLLRHPTTSNERKIVCGNLADTLWTGAVGTVQAMFDFGTNASANYTLAGRVGEKKRAI